MKKLLNESIWTFQHTSNMIERKILWLAVYQTLFFPTIFIFINKGHVKFQS